MVEAQPDILNHNVETVPRLQRAVRRRARWDRQRLGADHRARASRSEIGHDQMVTKTGLMVGLGETTDELLEAMRLLREADIDVLTIGQYLRPSRQHLPLHKYYTPAEFVASGAWGSRWASPRPVRAAGALVLPRRRAGARPGGSGVRRRSKPPSMTTMRDISRPAGRRRRAGSPAPAAPRRSLHPGQ